ERGNGLPVLFGLDVPTDLPTTILGLQKSSGNQAVAELLHCSEHDTTEANELSGPMSSILNDGRGQPLEPTVRAFMESRFHHDFGGVRIHANDRAAQATRDINSAAYTVGQDIVLNAGQYAPDTPGGIQLLAHELAHVVQQRGADSQSLWLGAPNDVAEVEADEAADTVGSSAHAPSSSH